LGAKLKLISWNVNGIRAAVRKGFNDFVKEASPDILCLQEVKAKEEQGLPILENHKDTYNIRWNAAKRAGYSGVATFSKPDHIKTEFGFDIPEFDDEGRVILSEYEKFYLFNIYFPNGQRDAERLDYKMRFYDAFLELSDELKKSGKAVITCGDYNTAHKEIDLKNPKANEKNSGFLPIERAWMDKMISHGYVDTFRMFSSEADQYTWWTYRMNARERNVGWRIDYFFIDEAHKDMVKDAFILPDVFGSDHCPLGIELDVSLFI
jgi:exodeoxyribonuclease-3